MSLNCNRKFSWQRCNGPYTIKLFVPGNSPGTFYFLLENNIIPQIVDDILKKAYANW